MSSLNQDVINKLGTYSGTLKNVSFDKVDSIPKKLNLSSLKVERIRFNNNEHSSVSFPKNVLKTARIFLIWKLITIVFHKLILMKLAL